MMTGRVAPSPEECDLCGCKHMNHGPGEGCQHECHPSVNLNDPFQQQTQYSTELRNFVCQLLRMNRAHKWSASELMEPLEKAFGVWRRSTDDGKLFVDVLDDLRQREERIIDEMRKDAKTADVENATREEEMEMETEMDE